MTVIILKKKRPAPIVNLADVLTRIDRHDSLSDTRRRDLKSAVSRAARILNRHPQDLAANVPTLREGLLNIHPTQAGIKPRTLANVKADLARALELVGAMPAPSPDLAETEGWRAFLAGATAPHQKWSLARLQRYCTAHGIEPGEVSDEVMYGFSEHLDKRLLTRDPQTLCKNMAVTFNCIVKRSGLAIPLLRTRTGGNYVSAPFDAYPEALQTDIERYVRRLAEPELFSADSVDRPHSPVSIRNTRAHLRQTLDAAVSAGYSRDHFQRLSDLIDIPVIKAATVIITARSAHDTPSALQNILTTLLAIARYEVKAPPEVIAGIAKAKAKITKRLGNGRPRMAQKNVRLLEQLDDQENIARLIRLPNRLMNRADKNAGSHRAALDALHAVAITILLSCPMRMKNLAALDLKENITVHKKGSHRRYSIHIPAEMVKNRRPIETDLGPSASRVLSRYLDRHRHLLAPGQETALFPRASGGARSSDHFGEDIKAKIYRETGLKMHPHLFRHFCAQLFLEAHPGEYETVRRLVGHAKMETTVGFYAPLASKAAFGRWGDVLAGHGEL